MGEHSFGKACGPAWVWTLQIHFPLEQRPDVQLFAPLNRLRLSYPLSPASLAFHVVKYKLKTHASSRFWVRVAVHTGGICKG